MMSVWKKNSKNICLWSIINTESLIRKYSKRASKIKWTYREYHVQYNADVAHKYVKMYCDTNQLPELTFCGPHPNPHVARGLSNNYN